MEGRERKWEKKEREKDKGRGEEVAEGKRRKKGEQMEEEGKEKGQNGMERGRIGWGVGRRGETGRERERARGRERVRERSTGTCKSPCPKGSPRPGKVLGGCQQSQLRSLEGLTRGAWGSAKTTVGTGNLTRVTYWMEGSGERTHPAGQV